MAWRTWRGVLGGSLATLLLVAPAMLARAQTPAATQPAVAKPAVKHTAATTKPKPKVVKTAAKHEPAQPAKKLAAAKPKPAEKHFAAAKKKSEPAKKIEVARKSEPKNAEPTKLAAAPPSYTITTVHDGVTQTTTRVVPLTPPAPITTAAVHPPAAAPPAETKIAAAAPAAKPAEAKATDAKPASAPTQQSDAKPAEAKPAPVPTQIAAIPVSLTEPAHPAAPASFAAMAATAMAPLAEKSPAIEPADPKAASGFVSRFLAEAFHIAKSDGTSLQRRARLADLFASHMDVKRIAGYTTADELSGATSEIQQRFRTILVSYLVETYYPQLELASDPTVTVDTAPVEPLPDGTAVVWTTFTKDGWGSQSVKWHLVNEGGHYEIVDIFSAGASLVQMERDTFKSVMRNGGLNELMAKLDARTKELASAATE